MNPRDEGDSLVYLKSLDFTTQESPSSTRWGGSSKKHNVILISDEIHCDLVNPDKKYVPFENIAKDKSNIITCLAPTKTFNIAGIQGSIVYVPNKQMYESIKSRLELDDSSQINVFSIVATVTAFNECESWLNQLNEYIYKNKQIVDDYFKNNIPQIKPVHSQATYLLWLDCTQLNVKSRELNNYLNDKTGLLLSPGIQFGENGDNFLRLNIACPKEMLLDGLKRLKQGVYELKDS